MPSQTELKEFSTRDLFQAAVDNVAKALEQQEDPTPDEIPWTEYLEYVTAILEELRMRFDHAPGGD